MRLVQWLTLVLVSASPVWGASSRNATQASLVLSAESARPGEMIFAGVRLTMNKGWHTYWRNGGESGTPTTIDWKLPAGVKAGPIQWPAPEKLTVEDITTYVYHGEAVLLVPLTIEAGAAKGEQEITAKVSWLECQVNCLPGDATVRAKLVVGGESKPSAEAAAFKNWQSKIPQAEPGLQARAWWEKTATGDSRPAVIEWAALPPATGGDFFPYENEKFEVAAKTESLPGPAGKIQLRALVKKSEGDWPKELAGLVIAKSGGKVVAAYDTKLGLNASSSAAAGATKSLGAMLLLAFLGGLILNVMPCVLPVIALKILGFVSQSKEAPGRVRRLGIVYALGVLASFLVLAVAVIAVQQAGHKASWGMQFGNPMFLVALTVLVTLVTLNLFGVFEVTLGGSALGAAAELAGKEGSGGAFFNGVLATALATPCTAPFLGVALGFAFAQPPAIIVLMFLTVGLGLAFPYVLLSWQPAWLKFLPKPGVWMEQFKMAMGFPMLATAVWLFTLAQGFYEKRVLWLGLFLVIVALAAWIYGQFIQRGGTRKGLAVAVLLVLLAFGYGYALEGQLRWRSPAAAGASGGGSLQESPGGIAWQPWSAALVAQARAEGRPVFVDFTADWCLTCQANKKTSIEIASVRAKLKEINAVALLGDYTRVPEAMTAELNRFGRAGVPLVLVYPKNPNATPIVLPEVLTPNIVLTALEKAGEEGK